MSTEKLLQEYVRTVLKEYDAGGGDSAAYGIMMSDAAVGPYGLHYGSGDDLYKIFVKPFVDVVETAAGKTKEMSQRTQTLVRVAFEAVATTLIPVLRDDYAEIFAKEKKEIEKIRSEYAEVYKSNWDAFKDSDVMIAAFMCYPAAFLTTQFARKSPEAAAKLISVLSGGTLDSWLGKIGKRMGWGEEVLTGLEVGGGGKKSHGGGHGGGGGGGFGDYGMDFSMEGVLHEKDKPQQQPDVAALLSSDKVKAKLQQSPLVRKMEQEGKALVRNTLEQVFKKAQGVLTANSLQQLQQKTGAKIKGMEKMAQVPQQERQKAEQQLLATAKKSMKEFYVKNLEGQVKEAVQGGVPENSPYVQDYQRVIGRIKAL